jgi:Pyridoxamine 5'-phosphate oxidase
MLPDDIVEFLHGPQVFALGTRSAKLRPAMGRVLGAFADAAKDRISFFLPNVQCEPHLTNLADNGLVALIAGEARSHKNYQFKGRVVEVRASTPADAAIRDVYLDKLITYFRQEYFMPLPDNFFGGYIADPSTTITFRVAKIFNQTPGPNAGKPVDFIAAEG